MLGLEVKGSDSLLVTAMVVSIEVIVVVVAALSSHHDDEEDEEVVHTVSPSIATGDVIVAATNNNSSQSNKRDEDGSPKGLKSMIHTRFFLSTYKSTEYLFTATKVSRIYWRLKIRQTLIMTIRLDDGDKRTVMRER